MTRLDGSALRKGSHPEKNRPRPSPTVPDGPQGIYTSPKLVSMAEADPEGHMSVSGRPTTAQCSLYTVACGSKGRVGGLSQEPATVLTALSRGWPIRDAHVTFRVGCGQSGHRNQLG